MHKRFDPIYVDARDRIASLGDFSFLAAYMSQPKSQLETFRSWLGTGASDISYYLNCHHIDFHEVGFLDHLLLVVDSGICHHCGMLSDWVGRCCRCSRALLLLLLLSDVVVAADVIVACDGILAAQWCLTGKARPVLVIGSASHGVAKKLVGVDVEDTITLTVHWENIASGTQGGNTLVLCLEGRI